MQSIKYTFLVFSITLFITACIKPPEYPIEPTIEFVSLDRDTIIQSLINEDTVLITFSFTDGDGDLGTLEGDTIKNAFLIDKRDGAEVGYIVPYIPPRGNNSAISGEITIELYSTCCLPAPGFSGCSPFPGSVNPVDTLSYEIYIKDRAGNISNTIQTAPIYLECN